MTHTEFWSRMEAAADRRASQCFSSERGGTTRRVKRRGLAGDSARFADRGVRRPQSTVASVSALSPRLKVIVDALPLRRGLRVIEIGCGPGAAAREVAHRVGPHGHVLAVDRSAKAIAMLTESGADLIAAKRLTARQVAAEELELHPDEERYHIAFAVRVGAFDGRDPRAGALALERLGHALVPGGQLFVDGGKPLRKIRVPTAR